MQTFYNLSSYFILLDVWGPPVPPVGARRRETESHFSLWWAHALSSDARALKLRHNLPGQQNRMQVMPGRALCTLPEDLTCGQEKERVHTREHPHRNAATIHTALQNYERGRKRNNARPIEILSTCECEGGEQRARQVGRL